MDNWIKAGPVGPHQSCTPGALDTDEATSDPLGDSRVQGANLPGGPLQRQEQTDEIRRPLDDEAASKQKAEEKVDRLEKEVQELRDIVSLLSREPLEGQTHPGTNHPLLHVCRLWRQAPLQTAGLSTSLSRSSTSSSDPEQSSSNFARFYAGYKPPGRA
ncbi:hypothetical protein BU15DRAFT_81154 [Melanogaster broomeanus]|nr:hypothetical protein BU15DRAFT_81154 [Melanogaster broomeanus]